jgi:hypothetical protein
MDTMSEPDRRAVLAAAAAAGAFTLAGTPAAVAARGDSAIRPLRINFPEDALVDLRRRLSATRWPEVVGRTINGHPAGDLTRDDFLDDITLYWLTNTAISAARFYWESKPNLYNAANVSIPAAVSVFPGENYEAPRSWAERAYHKLIYYNKVDEGGHYAA